jgi:RNA polymerase sigma factor (sigma-70 family)
MSSTPLSTVFRQVRGFAGSASDGELLEHFKDRQDEAAFAALVARHGPMILGLCRRLLHDRHDAEDAFQATFLVLVCRAGAVAKRDSVGSWLYGVAYRIALRAKARAARLRGALPEEIPDARGEGPAAELERRELAAVLDEELIRRPEKYRTALVLCGLEGLTGKEAAQRLGLSFGTLRRRLERGRELLRRRLTRRGVLPAAAFAAGGLAEGAVPAAVPAQLAAATLKAAVLMAAGKAVATGAVSVQVAALTKGVLNAFLFAKVKTITAVVLLAGVFGTGAGMFTYRALGRAEPPPAKPQAAVKRLEKKTPAAAQPGPSADESKPKTITVRVLGADGKPLAGADVVVIGQTVGKQRIRPMATSPELLGQGRAGDDGRFSFTLPGDTKSLMGVCVLARTAGYGLSFQGFDPAAAPAALDVHLSREQPLRVRLVNLQGVPASGVRVRVAEVTSAARTNTRSAMPAASSGSLFPPAQATCWSRRPRSTTSIRRLPAKNFIPSV